MFYDEQPKNIKENYKRMLAIMGSLSNVFSESDCPYLSYRAHENIFCRYLETDNLARLDVSIDAKKGRVGIGLKTWTKNDDQKIAEFGKLKKDYEELNGLELVRYIAECRNKRIKRTMKNYNITKMVYHVVRRIPNKMQILECELNPIDIEKISLYENKGNENNTYFTDGIHMYHFSSSKNTLYMHFKELILLDEFEVDIADDPFSYLWRLSSCRVSGKYVESVNKKPMLCLPLYSVKKGEKFVPTKSGLNHWNAGGRDRDVNELYIPYNKIDRDRDPNFFPPRDSSFILHLPNGSKINAKVCQEADKKNQKVGKAIMSNPNKILGEWLLRDVFELPNKTVITYDMLLEFGIDSVVFTKNSDLDYSIDFAKIGTYEKFYR